MALWQKSMVKITTLLEIFSYEAWPVKRLCNDPIANT